MPVLEKQVDARLVALFKKHYPEGVCIKMAVVGAHGTAGWPDRCFIANGRVAFVELKAPGKKPTPLQEARMNQLRHAGAKAEWFDDADTAMAWLKITLEWTP